MNYYFRTKSDPHRYYAAQPVSTDRSESFDVKVFWVFSRLNSDETFILDSHEIPDKYEPCSAFEAISSSF